MFYYHCYFQLSLLMVTCSMFLKAAIVSIIKNKTGDTSDKNNYRHIAIVIAASTFLYECLSVILESYCLHTINNLVSRVNIQLIFVYKQ